MTAALWILVAVGLVVGAAILAWWWDRLIVAVWLATLFSSRPA